MKCSYCSSEIEKGTGTIYVRKNGAIRYYCSKRCLRFNVVHNRRLNKKELKERSQR
ncbi:MAG: 50S ribosomal protein L24e [Candidatus Marsarchaeota archaeon]|nr:50S ribosomal protein L24e [Candidatus Marsarchaeota archaeon]MCL5413108.1 50S ribosomal protein L24e [Candidatus Marsarchaeota archaeon]